MVIECPRCDKESHIIDKEPPPSFYRCDYCSFLVWREPDSSDIEYWGRYTKDGEIDWDKFNAEQKKGSEFRSTAYLADLRKLSDSEFMAFASKLLEQMLEDEKRNYLSNRGVDAALHPAMYVETDRRTIAAGWFWRRWRKPQEYRKWVEHGERTEQIAWQISQEIISRTHPDITLGRE